MIHCEPLINIQSSDIQLYSNRLFPHTWINRKPAQVVITGSWLVVGLALIWLRQALSTVDLRHYSKSKKQGQQSEDWDMDSYNEAQTLSICTVHVA